MLVLNRYNVLPIFRLRRTNYLRFLGRSSAHLLHETTSAVTSANPSTFFLRKPLWNDLDFVPCRVKPRSTCSSYPTRSPPPEFHDWTPGRFPKLYKQNLFVRSLLLSTKVFRAAADFSHDFAHAYDQHQGDCHTQTVLRS